MIKLLILILPLIAEKPPHVIKVYDAHELVGLSSNNIYGSTGQYHLRPNKNIPKVKLERIKKHSGDTIYHFRIIRPKTGKWPYSFTVSVYGMHFYQISSQYPKIPMCEFLYSWDNFKGDDIQKGPRGFTIEKIKFPDTVRYIHLECRLENPQYIKNGYLIQNNKKGWISENGN